MEQLPEDQHPIEKNNNEELGEVELLMNQLSDNQTPLDENNNNNEEPGKDDQAHDYDSTWINGSEWDSTTEHSNYEEEEEEEEANPFGSFEQYYRCLPVAHIKKPHLEDGNRIIMPTSVLYLLLSRNIEYPMLFEIKNPSTGQVSHCGVLEFSAEEGFVILPNWMMKSLQLQERQLVNIKSTSLPKGTYMKIRPHTMKFVGLTDPKAVLETNLRAFACLTVGDTISVSHGCNQYYFDILETKPSNAISIIDTDCELEFATPLDFKDHENKVKPVVNPKKEIDKAREEKGKEEAPKFKPFLGVARRLDGQQPSMASAEQDSASALTVKEDDKEKILNKDQQKFQPFTGKKHTLGG